MRVSQGRVYPDNSKMARELLDAVVSELWRLFPHILVKAILCIPHSPSAGGDSGKAEASAGGLLLRTLMRQLSVEDR